jgi:hypothetical protein
MIQTAGKLYVTTNLLLLLTKALQEAIAKIETLKAWLPLTTSQLMNSSINSYLSTRVP